MSGVVNCEVNEDALGIKKQSSMMENTTESRTDRIRKLKFESNPQETSCFIGNLDFSITEGDILTLCNKLLGEGVATRVRLALDKETGSFIV